jgi:hypothetical protein
MKPKEMPWPPLWRREDMPRLAADWITEIRAKAPLRDDDVGVTVTLMNFTASHDVQWAFLEAAVAAAEEADELGAIAAGPFEHLLGHHGDAYIDAVERRCAQDPKWARVADGAWQYMMSDAVWARVRAIQERDGGGSG